MEPVAFLEKMKNIRLHSLGFAVIVLHFWIGCTAQNHGPAEGEHRVIKDLSTFFFNFDIVSPIKVSPWLVLCISQRCI
jgi:hypothetical protein